jgi:signal transduction histidine kinase
MSAVQEIADSYARVLREYLNGAGEESLRGAYELGRRAVSEGLGLLDVVAIAQEASRDILTENGTYKQVEQQQMDLAGNFLVESLSAFEMTHRSYVDANVALRRLNEILEEEIKRIAYTLHDDAGQLLASVHLTLAEWAQELRESDRERIQNVRELLNQIQAQLRRLSHELRPSILDDLGLKPAIEFLAEGLGQRAGLFIHVDGSTDGRLPATIEITLYRIIQESLNNAIKHSGASRVGVRLDRQEHALYCTIFDNGRGFNAQAVLAGKTRRGLGLLAIQERLNAIGGALKIGSDASGTTLTISIPLEDV